MALSPAALITTLAFLVEPVSADFGWSSTTTLTLFSVPTLLAPLALPLAGRWVDRFGARVVAIPGTLLYGLAIAAVSLVGASTTQMLLAQIVLNFCGYMSIMGVVYKVVAKWFPDHRGAAFGILIGAASSVGGAVIAPLCQWTISAYGWRTTYVILGAAVLLIVFPAQILFMEKPERTAQARGGTLPAAARLVVREEQPGVPFLAALRTRAWIVAVAILTLAAGAAMSIRLNATSLFGDAGYSATAVSFATSLMLLASVGGQIAGGVAMDRSRSPRAFMPFVACLVLGLLFALYASGGVWMLYLSMALLGMVMGAEASVGPYLIARYFGLRAFAQIQGVVLGMVSCIGVGLFPILVSGMTESSGSYGGALVVLIAVSAVTLALVLLLPRYPEVSPELSETDEATASDLAHS
ncbi:MFS transporter [Streptomyces adelaidensis]|uniref:MFS transporter n=1 Tax=Streptomyces adelaidensis TaxID=2796465 RepID=UPI0019061899|nr:MFS transporter [Streptomyces adelaidensis]